MKLGQKFSRNTINRLVYWPDLCVMATPSCTKLINEHWNLPASMGKAAREKDLGNGNESVKLQCLPHLGSVIVLS